MSGCERDGQASSGTVVRDADGRPLTILVVEDDRDLLDAFTMALRVCGYEVVSADGGEAALAAIERCGKPVDVVLTDVVMSDMSGVELVRRLSVRNPSLRSLYMSGYPAYVLSRYGLDGQEDDFLHKPFAFELLEQKLEKMFATDGAEPSPPRDGRDGA